MSRTVEKNISFRRDALLCAFSAALLILSFPKFHLSFLSWIAFVPLFSVIEKKTPQQAFRWALFTGFIFFLGVLTWIHFVTIAGLIALSLYLALYVGIFGFLYVLFADQKPLTKLLLYPAVWVSLEFLRSTLLTGFSWGALGLTQYQNILLIQISEVTGVAGISYLIMMVNVFVKDFAVMKRFSITIVLIFSSVFFFGWSRLHEKRTLTTVRVGVVQANIEQALKWQTTMWLDIMQKHKDLSEQAAAVRPELIIWPETSFPGYLWDDVDLFEGLKAFQKELGPALLVGSVTSYDGNYYNSALLLTTNLRTDLQQYHKMHLVAFGEFIPLRRQFPFLSDLAPIVDFTPGTVHKVFQLNLYHFGVLICFEDTVADLARQFVKEGAQFLVNITNDAWFNDSKEPYMHLQASVFRAVENRRSVVRSANTGISGFIDPYGRIKSRVEDASGKPTYVEGMAVEDVEYDDRMTLYTRFGEFFAYICLVYFILCIIMRQRQKIIRRSVLE